MDETTSGDVVHVVDDDASALRATARLLSAAGFAVRAYASGAELLAALDAETARGGCVLADLRMPGMDGLRLQEELERAGRCLPVVFLTGSGSIPTSVEAMRGGAEDYLCKDAPGERIIGAVRRALARARRSRAARETRAAARRALAALSDREAEVLRHVLIGKLNKQIAADLGIGERTVKLHRTAITRKIGVPSVAELSRLAHQAGWWTDDEA